MSRKIGSAAHATRSAVVMLSGATRNDVKPVVFVMRLAVFSLSRLGAYSRIEKCCLGTAHEMLLTEMFSMVVIVVPHLIRA